MRETMFRHPAIFTPQATGSPEKDIWATQDPTGLTLRGGRQMGAAQDAGAVIDQLSTAEQQALLNVDASIFDDIDVNNIVDNVFKYWSAANLNQARKDQFANQLQLMGVQYQNSLFSSKNLPLLMFGGIAIAFLLRKRR